MMLTGSAASAQPTDFFWQNPSGGSWFNFNNWAPLNPQGPGGPGDTLNFDLGAEPGSRYTVTGAAGEYNRLRVHNDALRLHIEDYPELEFDLDLSVGLTVGFGTGNTGDLVLTGDQGAVFRLQDVALIGTSSSIGVVTVDGLQWIANAGLFVGAIGMGALTIENGASISTSSVFSDIGVNSGSEGIVTVTGAGSTWISPGTLNIGRRGKATLTIEDGGSVSYAVASVGELAGSNGSVVVRGSGSIWTVNGNLLVGEEGTGRLAIEAGGEVVVGGSLLSNASSQTLLDGGRLTINQFGAGGFASLDWKSGTLRITNESGLTIGAGGLFGSSLTLGQQRRLEVDQSLSVAADGRLFTVNPVSVGTAEVAAGGQLALLGGTTHDFGAGMTNSGHVLFAAPGTVDGPVTNAAGGAITALENVTFDDQVDGPGGFFGPGAITFARGYAPGASPAAVVFAVDVVLASTNSLTIELGGAEPGTKHDALQIAGTAELGGTLVVTLIDPEGGTDIFAPSPGDDFQIIFAGGGRTGQFSKTTLPDLDEFMAWSVLYDEYDVTLAVISTLPGDYNNDGRVDAGDYVRWRNHLGDPDESALNFNGDGGGVTIDDYKWWKQHYGNPGAGGGGLALHQPAIPEPATALLAIVGLVCVLIQTRRPPTRPRQSH